MSDLDDVLNALDPWLDKYVTGGLEALSPAEATAVGVWLLDAEVNNGGFDQYYFNTGGELAALTVQALRDIGAMQTASLLDAANQDIPTLPLPRERDARAAVLDQIADHSRFRALETEYYLEEEDRIGLLAAYLRRMGAPPDGSSASTAT